MATSEAKVINPVIPPTVASATKEPWQMRQVAFVKQEIAVWRKRTGQIRSTPSRSFVSTLASTHRIRIQTALIDEGKPVPPEVLADYPDLAAQALRVPTVEVAEAPGVPESERRRQTMEKQDGDKTRVKALAEANEVRAEARARADTAWREVFDKANKGHAEARAEGRAPDYKEWAEAVAPAYKAWAERRAKADTAWLEAMAKANKARAEA